MSNSIAKDFKFFSLLRFALPTMVMMIFMSLYSIVDGIFISRLLGTDALSASNIVYPVISIVFAVGIMLSIWDFPWELLLLSVITTEAKTFRF